MTPNPCETVQCYRYVWLDCLLCDQRFGQVVLFRCEYGPDVFPHKLCADCWRG